MRDSANPVMVNRISEGTAISGETKLLAVIGHPVSHSLSPRIHNSFAAVTGLPYAYVAFDVGRDDLERFMNAAWLFGGFNLTMPLKELVLPYLDIIDDGALAYKAVNTVAVRDGVLFGYNTDGPGFLMSVEQKGVPKGRALVLGTGGAAKAVALALASEGTEVLMASRRPDGFEPVHPGTQYCRWDKLKDSADGCTLLVNATPLGMHGTEGDFTDLSFLDALSPDALVYDLVYAPRETPLLKNARTRGLNTMNGLSHLVCQAALAFEHFTGVMPPRGTVDDVLERLTND